MEFLILGQPYGQGANPAYRGVQRTDPDYVGDLGPTAAVNQLWHWYVDRTYERERPFLNEADLDTARDLLAVYRELGISYELVEVAPDASSLGKGAFLGYDVVNGPASQSALWFGLSYAGGAQRRDVIFGAVMELVQHYFQPRLNEYGLFSDRETAVFLLQVYLSLDEVVPGYHEHLLNQWQVLAVGVVREL